MESLAVGDISEVGQCIVENDGAECHQAGGDSDHLKTDPESVVAVKVLWDPQASSLVSFADGGLEHESGEKVNVELGVVDNAGEHALAPDGSGMGTNGCHQHLVAQGNDMLTEEGHMLHVPEGHPILAGVSSTMQVATSLATALTAQSDQEVIRLLLPNDEQDTETLGTDQQQLATLTPAQTVISDQVPTVQAITLADGTTAFIQHPNGKFLEGQTITLEDGSTAVVQGVQSKLTQVNLLPSTLTSCTDTVTVSNQKPVLIDSQPVQLEDGTTAYLNQAAKDSLQAIILEDGTTAYLATQQTQVPTFSEPPTLEATTLSLDQLTTGVSSVQALLTNGILHTSEAKATQSTTDTQVTEVVSPTEKAGTFGEKAYRCGFEDCGRLYTTLHHLKVHERSHTGVRPFKCEATGCGKAFATGYGLKSHTRVHTGEKPYKCLEAPCDKAFKTSGDLQKHLRTHTGERPFKCPFEGCTRSFTTSNIRKVHIRTHTGERPYVCPEEGCGRAFASATNYKNHIRIHTGEKPYVCTVQGCGKRFTEYSSLYKHHVVHTHSKPYVCNHCGKTYRQTSTLAMHKRTSHGEDVTAESEADLFSQHAPIDPELEPPDKRARLAFPLTPEAGGAQEEGEGTLVINTSESNQSLTLVGADSLNVVSTGTTDSSELTSASVGNPSNILQQAGVATFTLGDQGQQVYVITDPAQLEALQQLAQQQFTEDTLDPSIITTLQSVPQSSAQEIIVEGVGTTTMAGSTDNGDIGFEAD